MEKGVKFKNKMFLQKKDFFSYGFFLKSNKAQAGTTITWFGAFFAIFVILLNTKEFFLFT